jgi:PKD repeat protein
LSNDVRFILLLAFTLVMGSAMLLAHPQLVDGSDIKGFEDVPIAFNVTVNPGGPVDLWWWDFEGDGTFDWSSVTGPNTTHTYGDSGLFYAVLRADLANGSRMDWLYEVEVVPDNLPPTVLIIGHPDGYVTADRLTMVELVGTATDDGEVVLLEWDFEGDGAFDWNSTASGSTSHTYTALGPFTAVFRATDDRGASAIAQIPVFVNNLPPSIDPAPRRSSNRLEIDLNVTARDPDGEVITYVWSFDDGGPDQTTDVDRVTHEFPHIGFFLVSVEVVDNDGGRSSTNFLVEISKHEPYSPPVIDVGEDMETVVGTPVQFDANPSAGTEAIVSYRWDLDGDGTLDAEGRLQTHVYNEAGTYLVAVRVEDAIGWVVWDNVTVVAHPELNIPPVPRPSVEQWTKPGRNLAFAQESHDPDGTIVLWRWDFDGDGVFDHSSSEGGNTTHVYPEEGLFVAVLQVTDNRGEVGTATVNIKVSWDAPSDDDMDDSKGAAVCCGSMVVVLVLVTYWTMRKSMATPRKDKGPREDISKDGVGEAGDGGEEEDGEEDESEPPGD